MKRSLCSISVIAIAATLALAGTVSAEPGNGPTVSEGYDCFRYDEQTICMDYRFLEYFATTPIGNLHYVLNGNSITTFTGPGDYQSTEADKVHQDILIRNSTTEQVFHYTLRIETSEGGITCNFRYQYQFVSGDLKADLQLEDCRPSS